MNYNKYFDHQKWTKKDSVEVAVKCAELALPIFEKEYPSDDRPRKAIEAVKAWLENPTEDVGYAAVEATYAADEAARSIDAAHEEAYTTYAADAGYAAGYAAACAVYVAALASNVAACTAKAAEEAGVPQAQIEAVFEAQLTKLK